MGIHVSRTDKDMPIGVRAQWWVPKHWCCEFDRSYRVFCRRQRACDLPPEPKRAPFRRTDLRWPDRRCHWVPDTSSIWPDERNHRQQWDWAEQPSTGAGRCQIRDECIQACKEYRGTGTVDIVPNIDQYKNRATGSFRWW